MSDAMFCVRCGREEPLVGVLCQACFMRETRVLDADPLAEVLRCRHCEKVRERSRWAERALPLAVEAAALGAVRVHADATDVHVVCTQRARDRDQFEAKVRVEATFGAAAKVQGEATVLVVVHGVACPSCSRRQGGYFESIVQVRGPGRPLGPRELEGADALVDSMLREAGTDLDYLLKRDPMHGGVDYTFGSQRLGRRVAKALQAKLGADLVESSTIHGRREGGGELKRFTYLVRIPPTARGTLARLRDRVVRIERREPGRTYVVDERGEHLVLEGRDAEALLPIPAEAVHELEIVYRGPGEAVALDPRTQRPVVLDPARVGDRQRVEAALVDGEWIVAP